MLSPGRDTGPGPGELTAGTKFYAWVEEEYGMKKTVYNVAGQAIRLIT